MLGRFYENTVKVNSVKHYEDLTYACYTVQFLDKNGEPVVMAARTLADDNDLENKAGDVSGKLITMKDDLAARQTQSYDGEHFPIARCMCYLSNQSIKQQERTRI